MKHHVIPPTGRASSNNSMRPQHPEKLTDIVEGPVAETRDMRLEQQAAFTSPKTEENRVRRSQGDQGRS